MNKYESYMEAKKWLELMHCDEALKDYIYESTKEQRFYLNSKLAGLFNFVLKQKQYEENLKAETKYSDEDIEFLKQFDVIDLTHHEAFLTKRTSEHYNWMRRISTRVFLCSPKQKRFIEEEINKLGDNYTPRLIINIIKESENQRKK